MTDVALAKARLRASLLAARRERTADALAAARAAVVTTVLEQATGWTSVAAYEPLRTEPGSLDLLAALAGCGVSVLVPQVLPDHDLTWLAWPSRVPLGVDAVREVSAVLAPALAVGRDGGRLGRGGGSFDRALARCASASVVAAVVFDDEVFDAVPTDAWDVTVAAAATPSGWLPLRNTGVASAGWQS